MLIVVWMYPMYVLFIVAYKALYTYLTINVRISFSWEKNHYIYVTNVLYIEIFVLKQQQCRLGIKLRACYIKWNCVVYKSITESLF